MNKTNLIIIGNGFDLQCKLKSSYNDFLIHRKLYDFKSFIDLFEIFKDDDFNYVYNRDIYRTREAIKLVYLKTLQDNCKSNGDFRNVKLNIWDFIFSFCFNEYMKPEEVNWINIEEYLQMFILNSTLLGSNNAEELFNIFCNYDECQIEFSNLKLYKILYFTKRIYLEDSQDENFKKSKKQFIKASESKSLIDFNKFLFLELNRFEENFRRYLFEHQNQNDSGFNDLATELYSKIIGKDHVNSNYYMNFNYTLPNAKVYNLNGINIHGYIGDSLIDEKNEVIFGFDQSAMDFNKTNYMFTKTYRKLHHRCSLNEQNLPPKRNVNRIKFFGHSLGEGDYSYFYSIFDFYDIYNNDIEIEFVYCFFNGKEPDEILFDLQSNIAKLFHSYGNAMYNDGHGKNLIHKLLLEKRLSLRQIDCFD